MRLTASLSGCTVIAVTMIGGVSVAYAVVNGSKVTACSEFDLMHVQASSMENLRRGLQLLSEIEF